jgi:hypothetical protein
MQQITGAKVQIRTKSQAPNIKQGPNGKTANSKQETRKDPNQQVRFFVWNLGFDIWSLFDIWCL